MSMLPPLRDAGVDYHVGVITTDMGRATHQGRLQEGLGIRWIDDTTPDPHRVFDDMARQGTNGSGVERGLEAVVASVLTHGSGYNAGFFRPDAQLATFVVSDENDRSVGGVADFIAWYDALGIAASDATFHSVVDLGGCGSVGTRYLDVTAGVGGITWDICAGAFDLALYDAATTWWSSQPMVLTSAPLPGSLSVVAEEPGEPARTLSPAEWGYEPVDNSVRTRAPYAPPVGTLFTIKYQR